MHRIHRGRGVASVPLLAGVLVSMLAAACSPRIASPSPQPSAPSPSAAPTASPRPPTPVPTPELPSPGPTPTLSPLGPSGRLLVRVTSCGDACGPLPGTTILDDGRIIWQTEDGRPLQARLTEAGLETVRRTVEATPALATDASYVGTLRPGAEPIPHGVLSHRFDVQWATGPVVVTAWDPSSLSDQPDAWVIPPEMPVLADLARKLANPVAWLGEAAFETAPAVHRAERFLVVVDLYAEVGDLGGFVADVDEVDWPFGSPIESAGEPIGRGDDSAGRCLIVDAADAGAMRAAESAVGASRDLTQWTSTVEYDWRRADGFVQVSALQLLPYEAGPCSDLVLSPP